MDEITILTYLLALVSGLLVGAVSPVLVVSRSVMFSLTLLHSILGGAILGVYINVVFNLSLPIPLVATATAIIFSILAAELVERGLPEDTATALSVVLSTTLTIIFSYYASTLSSTALAEAWSYVMGSSALVTPEDVFKTYITLIVVAPVIHLLWLEFKYIAFDSEGGEALGLNVRLYRYTLYSLIALSASVLASTIGVLVTHVIIAIPGALALKISGRRVSLISYLISIILMFSGYLTARYLFLPPSGGVGIVASATILLVVLWDKVVKSL